MHLRPPEGQPFYAVAHIRPPDNQRVWVAWGARLFRAARVAHPDNGAACWMTAGKSGPVFLPVTRGRPPDPARPWAGWHTLRGTAPDYWAPDTAAATALAAEPAFVFRERDGRMWSETLRFTAVAEAEASELAREMERDREDAARGRGVDDEDPPEERRQFWLDPTAVTYSPPGAVSPREAEARVMRAVATEALMRIERPRCQTFAHLLSQLGTPAPESGDVADVRRFAAFHPTGRDQDDMAIVARWFRAVTRAPDKRVDLGRIAGRQLYARVLSLDLWGPALLVLEARAEVPPRSWRKTAKYAGCSHETARRLYGEVMAELCDAANGRDTRGTRRADARLEALRAENRAAKRRSGA